MHTVYHNAVVLFLSKLPNGQVTEFTTILDSLCWHSNLRAYISMRYGVMGKLTVLNWDVSIYISGQPYHPIIWWFRAGCLGKTKSSLVFISFLNFFYQNILLCIYSYMIWKIAYNNYLGFKFKLNYYRKLWLMPHESFCYRGRKLPYILFFHVCIILK